MRKKRQRRRNPAWVLLAVLLIALSAIILARAGVVSEDDEVTPAPVATPAESPVIEPKEEKAINEVLVLTDPAPELPELPERLERYADIAISDEEYQELAAVVYLESANQSAEGQQAVAEVVFNRVKSPDFPNTVYEVLHQGEETSVPQFSTIYNIHLTEPGEAQWAAIDAALYGPSILPEDVVFFARAGENDRVWGKIGDHVFCHAYVWK